MAAIYDGLASLYGDEKYTDLTVTCGGQTFRLHRAVICSQSPFFEKACSGNFVEAATGRVDLTQEDPEIFAKFVRFVYTGNYNDEDHLDPKHCDDSVLQSVDDLMFSLRHGTDIPGLDHYDAELSGGMVRAYEGAWGDAPCRCSACMCENCQCTGQLIKCQYWQRLRRLNLSCDGSSDEEEYIVEGEIEEVDEELEEGLEEDPAGYFTNLPHAMLTSVRMYAMGDMFCVPALKVLARNRFYKAIERNMDSFDFPGIVDEVFETTGPGDWGLKDICVLFIRTWRFGTRHDCNLMNALQSVIEKHEDLLEIIQSVQEMEEGQRDLENQGTEEEARSEDLTSHRSHSSVGSSFSD
ncbi:hypothetical protein F5144DRAFT_87652 [Chaetomium tenue]|uniref:Uncharacterized protein n=1 Tax=Chaetomium tenue TaxID=1854479 RepID=A0ACB7PED0_9PEZI|nr:hypothetical protein F5144DRAFT_87652 [Chaetomium globosum]